MVNGRKDEDIYDIIGKWMKGSLLVSFLRVWLSEINFYGKQCRLI